MNKITIPLYVVISTLYSSNTVATENTLSFSDVEIGLERITYSEKLNNLAGLGNLYQSISVINPTLRNSAYIAINPTFGLYIDSNTSLASTIEKEKWTIDNFGPIQQNDFKIKHNEIAFRLSYQLTKRHSIISGLRYSNLSFTRSQFEFIQPGADSFNAALALEQPDNPNHRFTLPNGDISDRYRTNIAISEEQNELIGLIAYRYEQNTHSELGDITWYTDMELGIPLYSATQNTTIEGETLTDNFRGYSIMGKLGLRYQLLNNISLLLSYNVHYKFRNTLTSTDTQGNSVSVPEIELTNNAVNIGLRWTY